MQQPNRIKAAMRASRKAYGYSLSFPSPWVIDILGKLDFDYVFIDGEHGPFGLDQLEDLCRTAERHDVTPIARVPDIGSSTILRYLDRGIMGILGPHIATEADARQLIRACYFGPLGERSFGANRGTDYNAGIADKAAYYREANEQMLVCALLEDVAVLDNLDAILSVSGIDLYSIGPKRMAELGLTEYGLERFALAGNANDWIERIGELAELGASRLRLSTEAGDFDRQIHYMKVFTEQIMPHFH